MPNKHNTGKSIFDHQSDSYSLSTNFFPAIVVSNEDKNDGGRIRARIKGIDDAIADKDLPYAFPLLQKFIHISPQPLEVVWIMVANNKHLSTDRVYIGPIISQPQLLKKSDFMRGATSLLDSGIHEPLAAPSTLPENKGVYPSTVDIAIQGRDNTDIIFKKKEVLIRAGKFMLNTKDGEIPIFNAFDPVYLQLKHNVTVGPNNQKGGVANLVAGKINLLTHKDGSPKFVLNDQDSMISDEELAKILEEAHPMVFGDRLVMFLELAKKAFINHVHAYHGKKAQDLGGANDIDQFLEFDLKSILSKNIRIN